jgi:hypothetical protein
MAVVDLLSNLDLSHLGMCDVEHGGCGWFWTGNQTELSATARRLSEVSERGPLPLAGRGALPSRG